MAFTSLRVRRSSLVKLVARERRGGVVVSRCSFPEGFDYNPALEPAELILALAVNDAEDAGIGHKCVGADER